MHKQHNASTMMDYILAQTFVGFQCHLQCWDEFTKYFAIIESLVHGSQVAMAPCTNVCC